jgi:prepilin-type N-terminal cleavage/methylation domain-containing protein
MDCRRNVRRTLAGQRAFTLVEVSIAVLVMALAITTALAAMQRAFLQMDTARSLQLASSIMQCEIEKERLLAWDRVSDAAYQPAIDAALLKNPAVAGRFTLSRALVVVPDRAGQLVQVTLSVTWRTLDGRSLTRSYTTHFCQGGLYNRIYLNV